MRFTTPSSTLIGILVATLAVTAIIGCHSYAPNAGHEIVLVKKPIFFGHGGVDPDPVKTGRTYAAISTDGIDVNMQPQKFDVELPDTMTKDGVPITFHAIMVLKVTDSVTLIKSFGPDWYSNNLEEPFRTMVRQAVRKRGMNETAISTTALDEIDNEIHDQLLIFIKAKSLPVELVTMTVGRANPPDSVKNQRIETATQEQRIQTEQQMKLAEDQRALAETSRAKADNAYREAMGLSPQQFIQLETVKMQREVCGEHILDTHDHPVLDPVWKLYGRAIERAGPTATLLEWDDNIPSFDEVHAEALKANRFLLAAETAMRSGVEVGEEAHV